MGTEISIKNLRPIPPKGDGRHLSLANVDNPVSDPQKQTNRSLLAERKYSVPQAAKMLGMGETKMRGMIMEGLIPVLNLGGRQLLLEGDLEDFLNGQYGTMRKVERVTRMKLTPLPRHVEESDLLTG